MTPRRIVYTLGLGALAASVRELHTVPQHIDAPLSPLTPLPPLLACLFSLLSPPSPVDVCPAPLLPPMWAM